MNGRWLPDHILVSSPLDLPANDCALRGHLPWLIYSFDQFADGHVLVYFSPTFLATTSIIMPIIMTLSQDVTLKPDPPSSKLSFSSLAVPSSFTSKLDWVLVPT